MNGARYSEKSDVYAFGCVLWEMSEKKVPFAEFQSEHIIMQRKRDDVIPEFGQHSPSPVWIRQMVTQCLSMARHNRPRANELYKRLEEGSSPANTSSTRVATSLVKKIGASVSKRFSWGVRRSEDEALRNLPAPEIEASTQEMEEMTHNRNSDDLGNRKGLEVSDLLALLLLGAAVNMGQESLPNSARVNSMQPEQVPQFLQSIASQQTEVGREMAAFGMRMRSDHSLVGRFVNSEGIAAVSNILSRHPRSNEILHTGILMCCDLIENGPPNTLKKSSTRQ